MHDALRGKVGNDVLSGIVAGQVGPQIACLGLRLGPRIALLVNCAPFLISRFSRKSLQSAVGHASLSLSAFWKATVFYLRFLERLSLVSDGTLPSPHPVMPMAA